MASGAKPLGARSSVAPRITNRKKNVIATSETSAAVIEKWPGECSPKPFAANALDAKSKLGLPVAMR
ncbi:hypothetical protein AWB80_00001 [Caballeronia pedi]|uniref:Uncharacterized protein n=1 Tax=Caballeronia pedi TaxID=1777141 RepID=A0A157Z1Q4_9BURK|nr:hypothetical protein AWB80_00001 [Caballeronia pedi]